MAYLANNVYDSGLSYISSNATRLDITSSEATTYTEAITTFSLGNKASHVVAAPSARTPDGRKVTSNAISDGTVTATGTAAWWALTDGVGELIATGALSASQGVTNGNVFTLSTFDIGIPAPA